jgi:hypothetical protein
MLLKYPEQACIGIDEAAALVITDGYARAVSGDGKAGCCKKVVTGTSIVAQRIAGADDAIPLDEFLGT